MKKTKSVKKKINEKNLCFYIDQLYRNQQKCNVDSFFKVSVTEQYCAFLQRFKQKTIEEYEKLVRAPYFISKNYEWVVISSNVFYASRMYYKNFKENIVFKVFHSFSPYSDVLLKNLEEKQKLNDELWQDIICVIGPYIESKEAEDDVLKLTNKKMDELIEEIESITFSMKDNIAKQVSWWIVPTYMKNSRVFRSFGLNLPNSTCRGGI